MDTEATFRSFVLAGSKIKQLVILQTQYTCTVSDEESSNNHHIYMSLIIILIAASEEDLFRQCSIYVGILRLG